MTFMDNLELIQKKLNNAGYESVREPFDISSLKKQYSVKDCEIIAKKDYYNILYMEAKSNWQGIATNVLGIIKNPCLIVTKYFDSYILTTLRDGTIHHPKPYHIVISMNSKTHTIDNFIDMIKTNSIDTIFDINKKIEIAFDEFSKYKEALRTFSKNLEIIIINTKTLIEKNIDGNKKYDAKAKKILKMCQEVINDKMDMTDIKSMLIQHILTYRIFAMVYHEDNFHHTNTIAKLLESLKTTLNISYETINYDAIELIAESITDANHRQEFLKEIYETFYKKYDPIKAKAYGIVYTPTEAVNFMIDSTDKLLQKHFNKNISDEDITILDPATGTGTFPVHILRYIDENEHISKYNNEIYANEISILSYYIATLNIEHTYKELTGKYKEFENICWMDTLDMGIKDYEKLTSWFENDDNVKRISRQQKSKIHVIIGNPPYNAFQGNHNANSDKYAHLDKKIEMQYVKGSAKKQLKSYDMYKRFFKWSSDRINKNGIIAFISNNSFLDIGSDDIFRKAIYDEFDYIYVVNLKGNTRNTQRWQQEGGKLFDSKAQVGIVISFFIKTGENHSEIQYVEVDDYKSKNEKLKWLQTNTLDTLNFKKIIPDDRSIWLNQTNNNFDELIPVTPRENVKSIFKSMTSGIITGKDQWVYDIDKSHLKKKMKHYISTYNDMLHDNIEYDYIKKTKKLNHKIKYSQVTLDAFLKKSTITYSDNNIFLTLYRPFLQKYQYYSSIITHDLRDFHNVFKNSQKNFLITFQIPKERAIFKAMATNNMFDFGCFDSTQSIPLWKYDDDGKRHSNVTKYALELFHNYYKNKNIDAEDIFYYVYGIFNDPKYIEKYSDNLKRSWPRIPFAEDFIKYSKIGKNIFNLHCNFNNVDEYGLKRIDKKTNNNKMRLLLQTDKNNIKIIIDDITTLTNIPKEVLLYTFKPRNPIKLILDYYKEHKNHLNEKYGSDDENICKEFNIYASKNYKEEIIVLLNKITTVCVDTIKLQNELENLEWGSQPKLKRKKISKNIKTEIRSNYIVKIKKKNKIKKKKSPSKNYNDTNIDIY